MNADKMIISPDGAIPRLRHYTKRYGLGHALCAFVGRHFPAFWRVAGPVVTRRYKDAWLKASGPRILNLGGGNVLYDRWLTADVTPRSDVYADVTAPLPFPAQSIDVIYMEEVIEHVSKSQAEALLLECLRILKNGGWIRITTPSLNYFCKKLLSESAQTDEINDIFYLHSHRHIYSEEELAKFLEVVGFESVRQSFYRDAASHYGYFDTHPERFAFAPAESSQYWEASKPL